METRVLTIFYTSDVHGRFDDQKVKKIQELIKECDTPKILLDGGDILKGGNVIFYPIEKTFHYIEKLKYTAICMGNREFNYFRKVLYSRIKKYPFLACNLTDKLTKNPKITPALHVIIDIFRVTILGLTKPQYPPDNLWEKITKFRFENTFLSVEKQIDNYRKISDIFIILSHLGIEDDLELAKNLFQSYPEIVNKFIILGGHDHQEYHNDQFLPIIHNEPFLKSIAKIELSFNVNNSQKNLVNVMLERIKL
ncbi:MAG: metallophosphoesterase [bacterium]